MARRATVGARELKTRLGAYLQQVRQGRTVVITDQRLLDAARAEGVAVVAASSGRRSMMRPSRTDAR